MDDSSLSNSFIEFWKIPSNLISFNIGGLTKTNQHMVVNMPAQDYYTIPALYHWDKATFYAPLSGLNSGVSDITSHVKVNPNSCSVTIPFNLDQAVENLLTEKYTKRDTAHPISQFARQIYYRLKPFIPRSLQLKIRQKALSHMNLGEFPSWKLETSVDLLHRNLLAKVLETNPGFSFPMISFWPQAAEICFILTHDVETLAGTENIRKIIAIEQKLGFRSLWNFVPNKYYIDKDLLTELKISGHEVGVHGYNHDGRLFETYNLFKQRAEKINKTLDQWESCGFRSESNLRNLDWIRQHIHAKYDTSCLSSEWYGAQPGGSCTVFPFIYKGLVELPITLQQDFTLLDILKLTPKETLDHWIDTVKSIKALSGLILINVHPDYMTSPDRLRLYELFLEFINSETKSWKALPKDTADWWIERHNSELSLINGKWKIFGPAGDRGVVMTACLMDNKLVVS